MDEAASRVVAALLARQTCEGTYDPMARAVRQLNDAMTAVRADDRSAQRLLTDRLWHLHERLPDDAQHADRVTVVAWRKVTGAVLPVSKVCGSFPGGDNSAASSGDTR